MTDICVSNGRSYSYNRNASVMDYIVSGFVRNHSAIAIIDEHTTLTYLELSERVISVAGHLRSLGVKKGDRIAILSDPCHSLVVIILAILKLGACYIAIDRSYPKKRIEYIIGDSQPTLLITDSASDDIVLDQPIRTLSFSNIEFSYSITDEEKWDEVGGEDPAYIIYTSGSTGTPKGIIVSHRAVNNHMLWMKDEFSFNKSDRFLLKTPLTFDPSVWEILLPFYVGARLVVAKTGSHSKANNLLKYVDRYKITVLQLTPVILNRFLSLAKDRQLDSLKYLFVGGESLPPRAKQLFFERCRAELVNLYGPAEATIDISFYRVKNTPDNVEHNYIGKPIYNTKLYVLGKNFQYVNEGDVGELFIQGDSLSLGYLNNPELNESAFVRCPSVSEDKLYKTGDLVKLNENGLIEYVGRSDSQIKLNGVRIETDTIKNIMVQLPEVYDALFETEFVEKYNYNLLVCYIVSESGREVDLLAVKKTLSECLPNYMLPHKYIVIEKLSLSCNGKIDLKQVKKQKEHDLDTLYSSVKGHVKNKLFHIWSGILGQPIPSEDSDFYELGGDSLTTCILLSEICTTFSVEIDLGELMLLPTIAQQVESIKSMSLFDKNTQEAILSLNSETDNDLFLIHPIGGTVFWYLHLARLLDKKVHLYAIQDPGILAGEKLFDSIYEMADYYTKLILEKKPQGPYVIGGASFGGTVAVEVARKLIKLGHTVRRVLILDGWAVYPKELGNEKYFQDSMLRQQNEWAIKFKEANYDVVNFSRAFEVQQSRLEMLFDYKMCPFNFHIDVFKANEIMPVFSSIDEPVNHWKKYATNYAIYHIDGDHETMFLRPNIDEIAQIILNNYSVFQPAEIAGNASV